ncbi:hypothetical protein AYO20_11577 [Fonsecaea nubica]|uniref:Uncharacterized protein n=1 Tax=Fonsecaea nubica TaxID=856822 RepID=A0A178BSJ0_9EURO|nr:hypothetical protein AYO20_11577 [Fonsecaea nubica]OAL19986.1 hypothetical protein AYO20_11577 [Fonsecaea nubica]
MSLRLADPLSEFHEGMEKESDDDDDDDLIRATCPFYPGLGLGLGLLLHFMHDLPQIGGGLVPQGDREAEEQHGMNRGDPAAAAGIQLKLGFAVLVPLWCHDPHATQQHKQQKQRQQQQNQNQKRKGLGAGQKDKDRNEFVNRV